MKSWRRISPGCTARSLLVGISLTPSSILVVVHDLHLERAPSFHLKKTFHCLLMPMLHCPLRSPVSHSSRFDGGTAQIGCRNVPFPRECRGGSQLSISERSALRRL